MLGGQLFAARADLSGQTVCFMFRDGLFGVVKQDVCPCRLALACAVVGVL